MWVRLGSNNSRRRVTQSTNDGLSAPFSITKFQQPATLSRQRSRVRVPSSPPYFQSVTLDPEKNLGPFGSTKPRSTPSAARSSNVQQTRSSASTIESKLICSPTANRPARWHTPVFLAPSASAPVLLEDTCSSCRDCCVVSSRGS